MYGTSCEDIKLLRCKIMKELPVRKNIRLKGYDYSQAGYYFITVCVKDRHEMLGEIINNRPVLSEYGLLVKREIENIPAIRKECIINNFVIMPNHLHMIAQIVGNDGNRSAEPQKNDVSQRADCHPPLRKSLSNMVQGLKGAVTRRIGFSLWQRSFHDHIIRNEQDCMRIAEYIENNPLNWEKDCFFGGINA